MGAVKEMCTSLLLMMMMTMINMSASVHEEQFSGRSAAPGRKLWDEICPVKFDEAKVDKLRDILSQCSNYVRESSALPMSAEDRKMYFRATPSAADCHIRCLKYSNCRGFNWLSSHKRCYLLEEITTTQRKGKSKKWTSGLRNNCINPNMGQDDEIYEFFSNPFLSESIAKEKYENAKHAYDTTNVTRAVYSKVSATCLPSLISYGHITEDEMGTAASVEAGESPYMPDEVAELVTKDVKVSATGGPVRLWPKLEDYKNKNWASTGLYAKPGKLITVTTPEYAVGMITVQIGHLTDKLYNKGKKEELLRDPEVVLSFGIKKEKQIIGSPYGGMIFVKFTEGSSLTGSIDMKFENILEAPTFVLGQDSDEDWNNNIKNEKIPWTLIEVPQKITFVLPSSKELGVGHVVEMEKSLKEWKKAMDDMDAIAGITRPAPELFSTDVQISAGSMHAGYPMMGHHNGAKSIFKKDGLQNGGVGMGHEIGHNLMHPAYYLNHNMVNLFPLSLWPKMRNGWNKGDPWGRETRLMGYILQGKPNLLDSEDKATNFQIWQDISRMPLDIQGYETLPDILAPYKNFEIADLPADMNEIRDLWVKNYCEVTQQNMLEFFDFWNINTSENTRNICKRGNIPTDIMEFMNQVESMADAENRNCAEGWIGYSNKCIKITDKKYKWIKAEEACKAHGASLVSINSLLEATWAQYIIMKSSIKKPSVWIGSVTNLDETFPFANISAVNTNKPISLGKIKGNSRIKRSVLCTYDDINREAGGKATNCQGPSNTDETSKLCVMCEKIM